MPYIPPYNDSDYILDQEEAEIVADQTSDIENTANYKSYEYVGPNDIGVPDDTPSETPETQEDLAPTGDEITEPYYRVYYRTRISLDNYDPAYLQELANNGAVFYAIYDDDTEEVVDWDEIVSLEPEAEIVDFSDAIASATNQHFWDDSNGAHVGEMTHEAWDTAVDANFSDLSSSKNYYNILLNSLGVLLRRALYTLVSISRGGISFYDGLGNETTNIMSYFGRDSAQIGRENGKHLVINNNGITVYNGDGTVAPLNASNINAVQATINELIAGSVTTETLRAASAYIAALSAANVSASDISADKATINSLVSGSVTTTTLRAASAYIAALEAASVSASDISADKATLNELVAGNVTTTTLRAASAYIAALEAASVSASDISADKATLNELVAGDVTTTTLRAASAYIAALSAASVSASDLSADHATIGALDTNYAQVNLANVDNAWIENGTVKDGAITNAMINSVSANKLTAGRIDASNITVTNLNADNITAGTLNGERIGNGTLSLSKLEEDVYTETEVDNIVSNLQTQIDGAIETWTGTDIPTLQNTPAVNWNTNSIKDTHVGDVYFVVNSQSQQNGYNYRFTKIDNTYSWQLIKDNDVTNALQRLTNAEGRIGTIETFDTSVSSFMTSTDNELSSIKSAATTLAGRVDTAEGTLATKVDTTTFNTLSQTVEGNSSSIQQLTTETTTITNKITLDAPYTQVEWVEFTGKNICRLDYRPGVNGAFGFEIDFITYNSFASTSYPSISDDRATNESKAGAVFGVRGDGSSIAANYGPKYKYYALQTYASSGFLYDGGHRTVAKMYTDKRRQQCSLINGIYTAPDGSTVDVGIPAYQSSNGFMYVSGLHTAGGTKNAKFEAPSVTRIYSLKFYDDSDLAVNLIPAIRKSDSMTGLYDSVSGIFYPSYGMLFGDEVGDLGESPNLLNQLAIANPALSDLRTENTRLITVESNDIKKLQDGQRLSVLLKYTTVSETSEAANIINPTMNPAASNTVFLAVRDLEGNLISGYANPVYYNSTTLLTTHYAVGMILQLQFRMNVVIGTTLIARGWLCDSDYNTNTNDTARYVQWYNNIFAKKALRNASIIVGDDSGYEEIAENVTFDLSYPILWRTAALAINKTDYQYSWTLTYDRTLATCYPDVSGIKNQILYLVGEPDGGNFTIKSPILTFDVPTEEDELYYIPIGKLGNQSTGQNYLIFSTSPNPTMFAYVGNAFQQVQSLVVRTTNKLNETIDTVDEHARKIGSLETTVETKADGSTVQTISNNLSTLQQDVNGFRTTVSETYATKTEIKTTNEAEGSVICVDDAMAAPAISLVVRGKSEQVTTTGKNLFDKDTTNSGYYDGQTGEYSSSNITKWASISVSEGDIIRWANMLNNYPSGWLNGTFVQLAASRPSSPITIPSGVDEIRVYATNPTDASILTKNNDDLTPEPYSGGLPSPRPDWSQPILSVDDLSLEVRGKNLYGGEALRATLAALYGASSGADSYGNYVAVGAGGLDGKTLFRVPFKQSTQYTLILRIAKSGGNTNANVRINYTDGGYTWIYIPTGFVTNTPYVVTVTSTAGKTIANIAGVNASMGTVFYYDSCGIFEGVVAEQDFEPYVGTTVPDLLPDGTSLRSLPDGTKDALNLAYLRPSTREGWAWYSRELMKRVSLVVLDGSESYGSEGGRYYVRQDDMMRLADYENSMLCNYLKVYKKQGDIGGTSAFVSGVSGYVRENSYYPNQNWIYIAIEKGMTAADTKQWVTDNPITVLYPLATPVTETLPEIELPILHSPTCTVYATADATPGLHMKYWTLAAEGIVDPILVSDSSYEGELSAITTRVSTAESNITQNADNIATKVSKDGVISSINQSAETIKIQASKVEIDGTAIFNNSDFKNAADDAYASKASESLIETANTNANTALQTALDGAFLVLTSTNGQLFKNGSESTILQVAIFPNGGSRCDTIAQVRNRFGSTAYIEWKWKHESNGEWGTLLSNDTHLSQGGMWLTVSPEDVATKTTFSASLVVPD